MATEFEQKWADSLLGGIAAQASSAKVSYLAPLIILAFLYLFSFDQVRSAGHAAGQSLARVEALRAASEKLAQKISVRESERSRVVALQQTTDALRTKALQQLGYKGGLAAALTGAEQRRLELEAGSAKRSLSGTNSRLESVSRDLSAWKRAQSDKQRQLQAATQRSLALLNGVKVEVDLEVLPAIKVGAVYAYLLVIGGCFVILLGLYDARRQTLWSLCHAATLLRSPSGKAPAERTVPIALPWWALPIPSKGCAGVDAGSLQSLTRSSDRGFANLPVIALLIATLALQLAAMVELVSIIDLFYRAGRATPVQWFLLTAGTLATAATIICIAHWLLADVADVRRTFSIKISNPTRRKVVAGLASLALLPPLLSQPSFLSLMRVRKPYYRLRTAVSTTLRPGLYLNPRKPALHYAYVDSSVVSRPSARIYGMFTRRATGAAAPNWVSITPSKLRGVGASALAQGSNASHSVKVLRAYSRSRERDVARASRLDSLIGGSRAAAAVADARDALLAAAQIELESKSRKWLTSRQISPVNAALFFDIINRAIAWRDRELYAGLLDLIDNSPLRGTPALQSLTFLDASGSWRGRRTLVKLLDATESF